MKNTSFTITETHSFSPISALRTENKSYIVINLNSNFKGGTKNGGRSQ